MRIAGNRVAVQAVGQFPGAVDAILVDSLA
jgi:hypothetical protein